MTQTQLSSKLYHHIMSKMRAMVGDDGLRDTKSSYDVIKRELSHDKTTYVLACAHKTYDYVRITLENMTLCDLTGSHLV